MSLNMTKEQPLSSPACIPAFDGCDPGAVGHIPQVHLAWRSILSESPGLGVYFRMIV
jgi:hypothetical protein